MPQPATPLRPSAGPAAFPAVGHAGRVSVRRPDEAELRQAILDLLDRREPGRTICPSEVARGMAGDSDDEGWRELMEPVRAAARQLVADGLVDITQGGEPVDPATARGPVRIRKA